MLGGLTNEMICKIPEQAVKKSGYQNSNIENNIYAAPLYASLFGVPGNPPSPVITFAVAFVLIVLQRFPGDCFPFFAFKYAASPVT